MIKEAVERHGVQRGRRQLAMQVGGDVRIELGRELSPAKRVDAEVHERQRGIKLIGPRDGANHASKALTKALTGE